LQLNHPNAVLRRWQATRQAPADRANGTKGRGYKDIVRELQEQLDAKDREIRQLQRNRDDLTEGRDWTWHDTPQQIAEAMIASHPDKAKRLGAALQNLAKSTTKKPR
jgi:hypothetical protein